MKTTVYSKPNCMPCKMTKRTLDAGKVDYLEINVEADADYLRSLGFKEMPVVEVALADGIDRWTGLRERQLRALVDIAGGAA